MKAKPRLIVFLLDPFSITRHRSSFILAGSITIMALTNVSHAADNTWNVASGFWNVAGSWTAPPAATDDAFFSTPLVGGSAVEVSMNNANRAVNSLTFQSAGTTTFVSGGGDRVLTIGAGGITVQSGAGEVTLSTGANATNGITLGADQTWTNNGTLNITSAIRPTATNTLTITGSGNTTTSGAARIRDALTLIKEGSGTLTMGGTATNYAYTGPLSIKAGTLSIGAINNTSTNGFLGNSAAAVTIGSTGTTGTLSYTGANASSTKPFTLATGGTGAFEVTQAATNLTLSGAIDGAGALTKTGAGTLTLSSSKTYTGATLISGGTLAVSGAADINTTSSLLIASNGVFRHNSSVPYAGGAITNKGGTISGSGPLGVAVAFDSLTDRMAPGNSPGIQTYTVPQSWSSFTYQWETNDFSGTVAGTSFDQVAVTGALGLNGGAGAYVLDVFSITAGNVAGEAPNFSEIDRTWTIATTTGGITGFDATNWTINTAGFTNPEAGTWALALGNSNNDLVLSYSAVPEPAAALLGGLGLFGLLRRRRLRLPCPP